MPGWEGPSAREGMDLGVDSIPSGFFWPGKSDTLYLLPLIHPSINPLLGPLSDPKGRHSSSGAELRSPKVSTHASGH